METQCIIIFWESCIMSTHSNLTKKEICDKYPGVSNRTQEKKGSQVYEQLESITGMPSWADCPFLWDHIVFYLFHLACLFQSFSQFLFCYFLHIQWKHCFARPTSTPLLTFQRLGRVWQEALFPKSRLLQVKVRKGSDAFPKSKASLVVQMVKHLPTMQKSSPTLSELHRGDSLDNVTQPEGLFLWKMVI